MSRPEIPVVEQIRTGLVDGIGRYEHRRRRRRRAASVVASVGVLVAVVAGVAARDTGDDGGDGSRVIVGTDGDAPGPLPGLHEVPPPPDEVALSGPYGGGLSPVWTGTELLAVGATDDAGTVVALAFDPTTRRWRELAPPPVAIGQGGPAVWTGEELIVCCGGAPESSAAAAYDPEADAWRTLPDAPVRGYAAAEWIGDRMVVVAASGTASFDPASDEWSPLDAPRGSDSVVQLAWSGRDLYAWPAPASRITFTGSVLDPVTGRWSALPEPPAGSWPAVPELVWTGESLVVLGGLPAATAGASERFVGARYDPSAGAWSSLPEPLSEPLPCECNLGSHTSLWTGRDLLVHFGALASGTSAEGVLLAYDPQESSWRTVGGTSDTALDPVAVLDDRVLLGRGERYYLSDPNWRPAATAEPEDARPTLCPAARHPWQVEGTIENESGDGLPESGTATRELALRVYGEQGQALFDEYGAVSGTVRVEDGRAWRRRGDGSVEIVDEQIATIVLVLEDVGDCPATPVFGPEGVPLTFEVHGG